LPSDDLQQNQETEQQSLMDAARAFVQRISDLSTVFTNPRDRTGSIDSTSSIPSGAQTPVMPAPPPVQHAVRRANSGYALGGSSRCPLDGGSRPTSTTGMKPHGQVHPLRSQSSHGMWMQPPPTRAVSLSSCAVQLGAVPASQRFTFIAS
jgi:hypothetical protein